MTPAALPRTAPSRWDDRRARRPGGNARLGRSSAYRPSLPPARFAPGSRLEKAGFEPSVPSYKGVESRRNCRDDAAIRCTGDARFRVPVKEHGLDLLSPCGPSLSLGVGFALDAFFQLNRPDA